MGSVGTTTELGGAVDLDVGDLEGIGIKSLGLGVRRGVLEEVEEETTRLLGPATNVSRVLVDLSHGVTADLLGTTERNDLLVSDNVLEEDLSALQGHTLDGGGTFSSVLVMNTEVRARGLGDPTKRRKEKTEMKNKW